MPPKFDRREILLARASDRDIQADSLNHREDITPEVITKPTLSTAEVIAESGYIVVKGGAVKPDPSNFSIEKYGSDFRTIPAMAIKA